MIRSQRKERLDSLARMCRAGRASAAYFYAACLRDSTLAIPHDLRVRDIRDCCRDLEETYLVRVFAEFEITLRDCWQRCVRPTDPPAEVLLNRVDSRQVVFGEDLRMAHAVREYRNQLIHGGKGAPRVTLSDTLKHLGSFLGRLPKGW